MSERESVGGDGIEMRSPGGGLVVLLPEESTDGRSGGLQVMAGHWGRDGALSAALQGRDLKRPIRRGSSTDGRPQEGRGIHFLTDWLMATFLKNISQKVSFF